MDSTKELQTQAQRRETRKRAIGMLRAKGTSQDVLTRSARVWVRKTIPNLREVRGAEIRRASNRKNGGVRGTEYQFTSAGV